jgi:putative membrane protein
MRHLLYFVVMAAAMLALSMSNVLPGFRVDGWQAALIGAVVLGVANTILKPILFILTLPITIVTLGLFLLVLNAAMLWLTGVLVPGLHVGGPLTTLAASVVLSVVGMIWNGISKDSGKRRKRDRD